MLAPFYSSWKKESEKMFKFTAEEASIVMLDVSEVEILTYWDQNLQT